MIKFKNTKTKSIISSILMLLSFNSVSNIIEFQLTSEYFNQNFSLNVSRISDSFQSVYSKENIEKEVAFSIDTNKYITTQYNLYSFTLISADSQRQLNFTLYLNNSSQSSIKILKDGNLNFESSDSLSVNCLNDLIRIDEEFSLEKAYSFIDKYQCHVVVFLVMDFSLDLIIKDKPSYLLDFTYDCYSDIDNLLIKSFQSKLKTHVNLINSNIELSSLFIEDKYNKQFSLNNLVDSSKLTIFYVWASWCRPCIETLKKLQSDTFLEKAALYNFVFISVDEDFNRWLKGSDSLLNLTNTYIVSQKNHDYFISTLNITLIPATFLIDPKKQVINMNFALIDFLNSSK